MSSFYSILYVLLRSSAKEQVSVGLLFSDGTNVSFSFSTRKVEFIKKLIPKSSHDLFRSYLFSFKESIENDYSEVRRKFLDDRLLSYLANYTNNLVTFSTPSPIDLEVNETNFGRLFEKFVSAANEE